MKSIKFNKSARQTRRQFNMARENYLKTGDMEYAAQIGALSIALSDEYKKGVM